MTAGQDSDIIQAPALIEGLDPDMVIADQAYEVNDLIRMIQDMGAMVVIPVRSNRNQQREYDYHWYKDRNQVERFSIKLNSLAVWPGATKSLIVTSGLGSTWCVPSSGWREC